MSFESENRWRRRPWGSALLRVLIGIVPLTVSLIVGGVVARLIVRPAGFLGGAVWWFAVLTATLASLLAVERLARRLLPLAMLLRLSLLFPDQAPSRFRIALRSSTVRSAQRSLERASAETAANQAETALMLVAALNVHDRRTRGHSERVRALTVMVGAQMGLAQHELDRLEWAGLLHDIGKLRVAPSILNKAGPPDDHEWQVLRRHPGDGGVIMAPLAGWLGPWVHGVDGHHEYHDGSGYPLGLKGDEIALSGAIVAVTDAFETMTAVRSYKKAMSIEAARAELVRCAGSQFNPEVVRAVLGISLPRLLFVLGPLALLLQVPLAGPVARIVFEAGGAISTVPETLTPLLPRVAAVAVLAAAAVGGGGGSSVPDSAEASEGPAGHVQNLSQTRAGHDGSGRSEGQKASDEARARDHAAGGTHLAGAIGSAGEDGSSAGHTGGTGGYGGSGGSALVSAAVTNPPPPHPAPQGPPIVVPPVLPPVGYAYGFGDGVGLGHLQHGDGLGIGHDQHDDP